MIKGSKVAGWWLGVAASLSAASIVNSMIAERLVERYGGPDLCGVRIPLPPGPGRFAAAAVALAITGLALPVAVVVRRLLSRTAVRPFLPAVLLLAGGSALLLAWLATHDVAVETLTTRPANCLL